MMNVVAWRMKQTQLEQIQNRLFASSRRAALRPMTNEEQMDAGAQIMRQVGLQILRATAGPIALSYVAMVYLEVFLVPSLFSTSAGASMQQQVTEVLIAIVMCFCVAIPTLVIALTYATGISAFISFQFLLGKRVTTREAHAIVRHRLGALLGTAMRTLIAGIIYCVLAIVLVFASTLGQNTVWSALIGGFSVFGIFVAALMCLISAIRLGIAPVIVVIERAEPKAAIARAKALMRAAYPFSSGYDIYIMLVGLIILVGLIMWGVFAAILYMLEVEAMISSAFGTGIAANILGGAIGSLPLFLTMALIAPYWSIVNSVIYLDRRVRLEGLDIELLSEEARESKRAMGHLA